MPVMEKVGVAISVKNAHPLVKNIAAYVTIKPGGCGALQEIIELILKAKNQYDYAIKIMREKVQSI